jgi:REP element-mobilizing transposase RayT
MDRLLDRGASGPLHLQRPKLADVVVTALLDGERRFRRYQLHAYVVMPNHVHVLVTPKVVACRWLAPLKGFTAYRANELLGSHGQAFWQDESYDHLVRSRIQFERIRFYIEENPVSAGLVLTADQHLWSSAASRLKGGCGQNWPPHSL